jgi:hypothetical protein
MSTESIKQALKRAFKLGQIYWSWLDSEYSSHWKKADAAKEEFDKLIEDITSSVDATPPAAQRQFVGLTRNEAMEIINSLVGQDWMYAVDAIEAKLKEKNT